MGRTISTKCIHLETEEACKEHYGSISFPIYQTATYAHPGVGQSTGYDYSRLQNPTREQVGKVVASLENGVDALAFSSGMAAIATLMELFRPGDHIIADADLYGGSIRLFDNISEKNGISFTRIDFGTEDPEAYITENTKAIYFETPTNPMMNVTDIAKMPHVLIAGSTGSGKSVCINTIITSIIYKAKPSEVKLVMVDPKVVELSVYNGIPHLLIPVVTDPKKAAGALQWAVQEMVNRYHLFAEKNVRDISGYNEALEAEGVEEKLPQIVIIIDELADLMMVAAKDVEDAICRLAQMARAAGMHLVIATQRPSVDVITGVIKANIASRIAFAVTSGIDSRTIIDSIGAEKLLGKGDMLFYPSGTIKPQRIQGAYVSDGEVEKIVTFLKNNGGPVYSDDIMEKIEKANSTDQELDSDEDDETDEFLMDAIDMAVNMGQISASGLQRRFKIGYTRAGRIIDQMEARGLISGYEGSKPRKTLITEDRWQELKMSKPALETMKEAGQKLVEANKTAETVNNE